MLYCFQAFLILLNLLHYSLKKMNSGCYCLQFWNAMIIPGIFQTSILIFIVWDRTYWLMYSSTFLKIENKNKKPWPLNDQTKRFPLLGFFSAQTQIYKSDCKNSFFNAKIYSDFLKATVMSNFHKRKSTVFRKLIQKKNLTV